ncbi:lytic transglycosylase domain-containing protein [Roseomonas mucosa]|nr:lytic transglycosylase domain-containing protein [Roseomonas mucosa]
MPALAPDHPGNHCEPRRQWGPVWTPITPPTGFLFHADPHTRCINAAAAAHRLPPGVLVILLNVEGGTLGRVSQNTNDTVDIGPMQVNQIWIPAIARHWRASQAATRDALLNNFCANVEAGAWILRTGIDEARGDFWEGVGYYHSHSTQHKTTYLRLVLRQALRLQGLATHANGPQLAAGD